MLDKKEMTITEKYFRAIGWGWQNFEPVNLPDITQSFADFKLHVLKKMEEEGYEFAIHNNITYLAYWQNSPGGIIGENVLKYPIKDNEILSAAVVAATRYFKTKGKKNE